MAIRSWCSPTSMPTPRVRQQVDAAYRNPSKWTEMAIYNIARTGYFSSDRSVKEYAEKIWHAHPVKVV
jgi:starch phosphorylase